MTKVCIIEGDPVLRLGVDALLREAGDLAVVPEGSPGAEDAAVLVLGLVDAAGLREVERLAGRGAVVVLTALESPSLLVGALAAGALCVLRHGCFDAADLAAAVRAAASGQAFLSPPVATALVGWLHSRASAGAGRTGAGQAGAGRLRALEYGLTPREEEIMELVARGGDNRSIAARLFISEKTVKNHIHHIYRRLKADNRQHAIAKWCNIETPSIGVES